MEFNEKHLDHIDNLVKYVVRSRTPEDATGEEMLALYPCYVFLNTLKQHIVEDINHRLKLQQAEAAAAKASAGQPLASEPVKHGKVNTKSKKGGQKRTTK